MVFLSSLLCLSAWALQHVSAAKPPKYSGPMLPIMDPFYVPPNLTEWKSDWKLEEPGTILRKREVVLGGMIEGSESEAKTYQLLYKTRDLYGEADASVTTIIVPLEPNLNRVISVQNAYDSPDPNCAPSYGLQGGAVGWGRIWNQVNLAFMLPYIRKGAVLNLPDYEGSNAAFAVGPQSAYQTLDSIRAALASSEYTGITEDAKVILFGYAGGALATEWATEFKSKYANELPIVGAVMGGPPVNITATYHSVNEKKLSQLNIWAMLGMMNAFPEMDEYMRGDLKTEGYEDKKFLHALTRCSYSENTLVPDLEFVDVSSYFHHGDKFLEDFETNITSVGVMGQKLTAESNPGYPLVFFYGQQDEVIGPTSGVRKLLRKWRLNAKAEVHDWSGLMPFQDHTTALVTGLPMSWSWMTRRFCNVEKCKDDDSDVDFELNEDHQVVFGPTKELR